MVEMTVLHCKGDSVTRDFRLLGKGGFSNVHEYESSEPIAIKSVYIGDGNTSDHL